MQLRGVFFTTSLVLLLAGTARAGAVTVASEKEGARPTATADSNDSRPTATTGISSSHTTIASEVSRTITEFARITPSDGYPMGFGTSIAVSGDDLVVGAPGYIGPLGNHPTEEVVDGTAYVFRRVGPRWVEIAKLLTSFGGIEQERLGFSVAMEGDYIVVGAPHLIGGPVIGGRGFGRAFIFQRRDYGTPNDPLDDVWLQDAEVRSPDEIRWGDVYGYSVAINDGVVMVGRPGWSTSSGSTYLYRKVNNVWRYMATLDPSDSVFGDEFGHAVSLGSNVALVGARHHGVDGIRSGATYAFRETDGVWSEEAKLTVSDDPTIRFFGSSVSLHGAHAIVAALRKVYVFTHAEAHWGSAAELVVSDDADSAGLGQAVAIHGDRILVGAPGEPIYGAAFLFRREADQWVQERKLVVSQEHVTGKLGVSVALGEKYAFAAADGQVYVYVLPSVAKSLRHYADLQRCFGQAHGEWSKECQDLDLVPDGHIDRHDFNEFLATFAGP